MPRLFIAIDLPERIKDDITATYVSMPGARWMDEEHLHLTLRFIGDTPHDMADLIKHALRSINSQSFSLKIKNVGFFPLRRDPRILWAGLTESEDLMRLQSKIERKVVSLGLDPEERKFHPHVTVARLNGTPVTSVAQYITQNSLFITESFTVSAVHLYASTLHKDGSHYTNEETYSFNGGYEANN
jgi:2'-5' RNA ligase